MNRIVSSVGSQLERRWFLIGLLLLIVIGLALGSRTAGQVSAATWDVSNLRSTPVVAFILFLMAVTLDSRKLAESLRAPGPVIWATVVNFGLLPLMALAVMRVQQTDDFAIGLLIAASVPCTMATASVWTRKAGGNDAVSLLVTIITNGFCFAVTPLWLAWGSSVDVTLDTTAMIWRLVITALLPIAIGQLSRLVPIVSRTATRWKTLIGVTAQLGVLLLVFVASVKAGRHWGESEAGLSLPAVAIVWISCIVLHIVALWISLVGAKSLGFTRENQKAVAFAASQKTLPIGILIAGDPTMFGSAGVPFAVFPILMYHASQLFIDTAIADRMRDEKG